MRLSHLVPGLSKEYLINCFISGLKELNKYEVMVKKHTTMKSAMKMALMDEDKTATINKGSRKHIGNKGWNKNVEKLLLYRLLQLRKITTTIPILLKGLPGRCLVKSIRRRETRDYVSSVMRNMWLGTNAKIRRSTELKFPLNMMKKL